MKFSEIRSLLNPHCDMVSKKRNGNIICRKGFYYTHGYCAADLEQEISIALRDKQIKFQIIDSGEYWTAFRGGAPIQRQSHWYVEFKLGKEKMKDNYECDKCGCCWEIDSIEEDVNRCPECLHICQKLESKNERE